MPSSTTHPGNARPAGRKGCKAPSHLQRRPAQTSVYAAGPCANQHPQDGASLADYKEFRRAAECLGDVYRADFNPSSSPNPVRLASLGQLASTAAK
ncbi:MULTISPECIES: hypothetical protein [Streptomyces]|uniref:Uncharacterized protein n=1 Tax=Streptomyces clavifer TaxID=68188 RepID=A0ABS4V1U5_9ACTN|nr:MULTISPECIES: hypothetical protein [Streptomyces]MBP2357877.1 hypothetical protein [Streptomyces clavifer]MDX2742450.1 hypothetical protein [Streptomyces sp. NRRL_B-2557]GHA86937.1 hypothetical protein GCM10010392_11410 [Streptomyces clavifer]